MAEPFSLDHVLNSLKKEEIRKTSLEGNIFLEDPLFPEEPERQLQSDKNQLYEAVGAGLWSFFDEATLGFGRLGVEKLDEAGILDFRPDEFVLLEDKPETPLGKLGAGIGALGGFIYGAPLKLGAKAVGWAAKPFIKRAIKEGGEEIASKVVVGSAQKIGKKARNQMVDSGVKKEVADQIVNSYYNLTAKAMKNANIADDFVIKSGKVIDDVFSRAIIDGSLNRAQAKLITGQIKKDLARRPLQNFKDLWTMRGAGWKVGNLIDEVVMFSAIDAVAETAHSIHEDRPYDFMNIAWGGITGGLFGSLKWLGATGKGSSFKKDFMDGIRATFRGSTANLEKAGKSLLFKRAHQLKEVMKKSAEATAMEGKASAMHVTVSRKGKQHAVDLADPRQLFLEYSDEVATDLLRKALQKQTVKYGKELIKWSTKEQAENLKQNWFRMAAGSMFMNARSYYSMAFEGAEMKWDDLLPGILIGAYVNRRGNWNSWDLNTRTNEIRKNLAVLGADTRNLTDLGTFNRYRGAHMNPIEDNATLKRAAKKAEELGIISNDWKRVNEPLEAGKESIAVNDMTKGGYEIFRAFNQILGGRLKFEKPLDSIPVEHAAEIEGILRRGKFDVLGGKGIKTGPEAWSVFESIAEVRGESVERQLVNFIGNLKKLGLSDYDINLDHQTLGNFPEAIYLTIVGKEGKKSLIEMAKNGELESLRDGNGDIMKGETAGDAARQVQYKINEIIKALGGADKVSGGGISRLNLVPAKSGINDISDAQVFNSVKNLVDSFESNISKQIGGEFRTLDMLPDLIGTMLANNQKKATRHLNNLFDNTNEVHPEFSRLLSKVQLLQGGKTEDFVMIPSANKSNTKKGVETPGVEIVGIKDPVKEAQARRLLNSVISILGAKGQYPRSPLTRDVKVHYDDILELKTFLERNGMRTEPWILEQFNNYVVTYILKETAAGTSLTSEDINMIQQIQAVPGINTLLQVNTGPGGGWSGNLLRTDSNQTNVRAMVSRWNTFLNSLEARGTDKTGNKLISVDKANPITVLNPESMRLLMQTMDIYSNNVQQNAKSAIVNLINSLSGTYPSFVMQLETFVNHNRESAFKLVEWLSNIKGKDGKPLMERTGDEGAGIYKINERGLDKSVIDKLKEKMADWGIHYDEIDALYQREVGEWQSHMENEFTKPKDDASITNEAFFKKYFPEGSSLTAEEQNLWIDSHLESAATALKMGATPNYLGTALREMTINLNKVGEVAIGQIKTHNRESRAKMDEAKNHLVSMLLSRLNNTKVPIITYSGNRLIGRDQSMYKTKFLSTMEELDLPIYFINSSGDAYTDMERHGRVVLEHRRFDLFEGKNEYMESADLDIITKQRKKFNDLIETSTAIDKGVEWSTGEARDPYIVGHQGSGGLAVIQLAGGMQPFAIPRASLKRLSELYMDMVKRYENKVSNEVYIKMLERAEDLEASTNESLPTLQSEIALRQIVFEKLTTSNTDKKLFIDLLMDREDAGKIAKRFALFHTPNFKLHNKLLTEQSSRIAKTDTQVGRQRRLVNKYHNKKKYTFRAVGWDDSIDIGNASIKEGLLKHFTSVKERDKYWKEQLRDMNDESAFDSITYISRDMMEYLSMAYGYGTEQTNVFKPAIQSNGDVLLFGKTVFVYDPYLHKTFFNKNRDVDMLTTKTAMKIADKQWNMMNVDRSGVHEMLNAGRDYGRDIDLSSIVLRPDRVKPKDFAKLSQSAWNYLTPNEAKKIFGEFYGGKLGVALSTFRKFYDDPMNRRAFFNSEFYNDQSIESQLDGPGGSQNLGGLRIYSQFGGDPLDLGTKQVMSQFYRKVIDPIINQTAVVNGERFGGKSVLIQSLDPNMAVKPTIIKDGVVKSYGGVRLPHFEANSKVSVIGKKLSKKDLEMKFVAEGTTELISAEKLFGKEYWRTEASDWTLGQLHEALGNIRDTRTKKKYKVIITTNRYPRTRSNDLTLLELEGFLAKEYGNTMIVNELDVYNIFEGDYDVDKNDYYWMHSKGTFNHISNTLKGGNVVQGIDIDKYKGKIENLAIEGNDKQITEAWHKHVSNTSVLKKQIGRTQKTPRLFNFLKNLTTYDKKSKEYVLYSVGNKRVTMDLDNAEWFFRQVETTQAIIDAGSKTQALSNIKKFIEKEWFPLVEDSKSSEAAKADIGFIKKLESGKSGERIRMFRKFKKGEPEQDLTEVDKDIIMTMVKGYSDLLNLGTSIFENTGFQRKPSYHDIIDVSDNFFPFMKDMNNQIFYKLNWKYKDDSYWNQMFWPTTKLKKSAIGKKDKDFNKDYYQVPTMGPFSEGTKQKAKSIGKGESGNVFEMIMARIHKEDPLKVKEYGNLAGDEVKIMDDAFNRFLAQPDQVDKFQEDLVGFVRDHNRGISTLRYLKSRWGYINRQPMNKKAKDKILNGVNDQISAIEAKMWDMLPASYKESLKGETLKDAAIKFVPIKETEFKDATRELYVIDALTRLSGKTAAMDTDIKMIRMFEGRAFGDISKQNTLGSTLIFDKGTIASSKMREWLANIPNYSTVEQILEYKLGRLMEDHGMTALYHYAAQRPRSNQIGVFEGKAMPVPYGKNMRLTRILRFLAKRSAVDVDTRNALKFIAQISSHYRNYFDKNWRMLSNDLVIDAQLGLNYEHLKFPTFSKQFDHAFKSFRNFKWKMNTGMQSDPFNLNADYRLKFYQEYFELMGKGEEFKKYLQQLESINRGAADNHIVDPIQYLSMITQLNTDIHTFASQTTGQAQGQFGNTFQIKNPSFELKNNPVWALLGGSKHFKGLTLSPPERTRNTNIRSIIEFSKQANTILEKNPSEKSFEKIVNSWKNCTIKGR